jgi:hypothetical protein
MNQTEINPMAKKPKYVVKQYSQLDPKFVAYHSKPMSQDAAQDHLTEMKGASEGAGYMPGAKWKIEPAERKSEEF